MNSCNQFSYKTARSRDRLSTPVRWLHQRGLLGHCVLDFGCGYGSDGKFLRQLGFIVADFDPYYKPVLVKQHYDTILCTYVLNVLFEHERKEVIEKLKTLIDNQTTCYITVRRYFKKTQVFERQLDNGTFQFKVYLDLPIIYQNRKFCIYQLSKL